MLLPGKVDTFNQAFFSFAPPLVAIAEINKRQAVAQIEASHATVQAAAAQELAAKAQLLTARWTVAAVIVAAMAVVVAAFGVWIEK